MTLWKSWRPSPLKTSNPTGCNIFGLFHNIGFKVPPHKVSIKQRFKLFHTSTESSRLENDLQDHEVQSSCLQLMVCVCLILYIAFRYFWNNNYHLFKTDFCFFVACTCTITVQHSVSFLKGNIHIKKKRKKKGKSKIKQNCSPNLTLVDHYRARKFTVLKEKYVLLIPLSR